MTQEQIKDLARDAVACCRSEFPGEGPDWDSDWWSDWRDCWQDGDFARFLAACKETWDATRNGQDIA